jgi:asparagine synthase (glutamine-hydrolysing)
LYETTHTERVVGPAELAAAFPDTILAHYDEPFNDHSYLPTFYLCRTARESITVALSGDGGDEVFGGYTRYRRLAAHAGGPPAANGRIRVWEPQPVEPGAGPVSVLIARARTTRRRLRRPRESSDVLADLLESCLRSTRLRPAARGPLAQALVQYRPRDTVAALLQRAPPAEVGLLNAMRYLDFKLTLGCGILVKVDRASMAVSLEVRPVYLHRDLLDLARRVPESLLADGQQPKKLLKGALGAWLPEPLLYRRKMGFMMPLSTWLRGDLRDLLASVRRRDGRLAELVSPQLIDDLAVEHLAGKRDASMALHSFVFLDRWLERWL